MINSTVEVVGRFHIKIRVDFQKKYIEVSFLPECYDNSRLKMPEFFLNLISEKYFKLEEVAMNGIGL